MGYDVTFHPIKPEELTYFIFDVIDKPELASKRVLELSQVPDEQRFLHEIYEAIFSLFSSKESQHVRSQRLAFFCACIASFLHPYWYVGNEYLSKLIEFGVLRDEIFHSLKNGHNSLACKKMRDGNCLLDDHYHGSGYASNHIAAVIADSVVSQITLAQQNVVDGTKEFPELEREYFDFLLSEESDLLWALRHLQEYCAQHGTGFIEASEIVLPMTGEYSGKPENLRAQFLKEEQFS